MHLQQDNRVKAEMIFWDLVSEIEDIGNHGMNILQAPRHEFN